MLSVVEHVHAGERTPNVGGPAQTIHMPTPTIPELLDYEAQWRRHSGAKEEAIRADLNIPPARYYQLLSRAIDTREALEHDPMLTHRLRRQREERISRQARRVAG